MNPTRWQHYNNVIATLAGLLGITVLVAGVFGFNLNRSNDANKTLESKTASQRNEISDLNETIAGLRAQAASDKGTIDTIRGLNAELQERVVELERQVQPVPDDTTAPPIRKAGELRLAINGDTINLNSIANNFGATNDLSGPDTVYLTYGSASPALQLQYVDVVRIDEETARYATCSIATGWSSDLNPAVSELQDDRTCLRLDSGRYATIRVEKYGRNFADLSITVWELP